MRLRPFVACLMAIGFAMAVPLARAQSCINYQSDPRREAYDGGDPMLTHADMLVVYAWALEPAPGHVYHLTVAPWVTLYETLPACTPRDYHGQPRNPYGGSGVLVGPDLLLTVRHLINSVTACDGLKFIFGYGNFSPNQWQMTCAPGSDQCWVTIPQADVYDCADVVLGDGAGDDWAVVRLDRDVAGGTPLEIRRDSTPPAEDTKMTIVGHPNHIPLKWEQGTSFHLDSSGSGDLYTVQGAHVLQQSSGSMAVDEDTKEVIGIVYHGHYDVGPGCQDQNPPPDPCYREDLASEVGDPELALLTPAYLAKDHIPPLR
jgi:V8-like Glu-specific endopeptidase